MHKTKYMPFSSYSNNIPDMGNLSIPDGSQIPATRSVNYLGILLDENMKGDKHIEQLVRNMRGLTISCTYTIPNQLWYYSLGCCVPKPH
ncbi:hypothetical protein WA026_006807 [Henosepilachna vigintioctopunctata]|uniref:Uncharacterized protein n=1 Tax=Henosepilachna vigintioctopunctata TaxID=420089 RepID=A0AAW1U7Z6_9CUCU